MPKVKDGGYASSHACLIPHPVAAKFSGQTNRSSVLLKVGEELRELPTNFFHYVYPSNHKPYACFMPDLALVTLCLTQPLVFLDHDAAEAKGGESSEDSESKHDGTVTPVKPYGFVSYVRKNGVLSSGLHDYGIRVGCEYSYKEYAGQLVVTDKADARVIGSAPIQKPEYKELCEEVARRFHFQVLVTQMVENYELSAGEKILPRFDKETMVALQELAGALEAKGDSPLPYLNKAMQSIEDGKVVLALPGQKPQQITVLEAICFGAMVSSQYYARFSLDPVTQVVKFPKLSSDVQAQFEAYSKECDSAKGYESPVVKRTTAEQDLLDAGYESDDELKSERYGDGGGECSIM